MPSWWNWWRSDDDKNADVEARPCRDGPCRHEVQLHFKPPTPWDYSKSLIKATASYWAIFFALYCLSLGTVLSEQGQIDAYCDYNEGNPEGAIRLTFGAFIGFALFPLILYTWTILSNEENCYRRWAYYRLMEYGIILDFKNREGWKLTLRKSKIFLFALVMSVLLVGFVGASEPMVLVIVVPLLYKLGEHLTSDRAFESQELITVAKFVEPGDGQERRSEDNIERACKILTKSEFMDEDELKWHVIGCKLTKTKFDWATVGQFGYTEDWVKEHPDFRDCSFPRTPYSYWGSHIDSREEKDQQFVRTLRKWKNLCLIAVFFLEVAGFVYAKDWAKENGVDTTLVALSASTLDRVDCNDRSITTLSPLSLFPPPPPPSPYPPPPPPVEIAFAISTGETCGAFLDGMEVLKAGYTAGGAPFYRNPSSSYFIYWDPDCDGNGQAPARWIVNSVAPSTSAVNDLDGDGECAYWARINSDDISSPPLGMATWRLLCDGTWTDIDLTLAPPIMG